MHPHLKLVAYTSTLTKQIRSESQQSHGQDAHYRESFESDVVSFQLKRQCVPERPDLT
jgi:hypothetical protein